MKNTILLIILLLAIISYGQEKTRVYKEMFGDGKETLKGNVKSVKEFCYDPIEYFGEIKKGKFKFDGRLIIWNLDGNIIKIESYNEKGEVTSKREYTYYSDKKIKEYIRYSASEVTDFIKYDKQGNQFSVHYDYNKNGKLEKTITSIPYFDKDSLVIKREDFINKEKVLERFYKYDKNKNKISQENFYLYGGSKTKTVWKYNNNKLVEYLDYDNGNFSESVKYDEKERLIEIKKVGEEGIHITSYKYDVKNNLIEDTYKTDKTCFITTYKYINNNKLEEITKHCNSKEIESKETFNYDSNNNLIEIVSFSKQPTRIITSKDIFKNFDTQGNWTQKIYYYNGEAIGLTERTIEYY